MNYLIASVICVIALLIAVILIRENELLSGKQKRQFIILAGLIIAEIILDTFSLSIYGSSSKYNFYFKLIKVAEFIIAPIIPTVLSHIICRRKYWEKIRKIFFIVIGVNSIAQAITIFYPFTFMISENAIYSRTPFTYGYVLLLFINVGLLLFSSGKTFIQNFHRINSLILIGLFILVGFLIRIFCISSNADWLCVTFSYFLFLEYFSNSFYKIDMLTSLLNQKAFLTRKVQINYSTALIEIDANYFKKINDTYGHLKGDMCLKKIGEAIFNVYSKDGFCYRSGGDEFTVILKPGVIQKVKMQGCNIYEFIEKLMAKLDKELKLQSKEEPLLKYGVSQGFGIYYVLSDCARREDYKSIDEVMKYADDRMYEAKAKRYTQN